MLQVVHIAGQQKATVKKPNKTERIAELARVWQAGQERKDLEKALEKHEITDELRPIILRAIAETKKAR